MFVCEQTERKQEEKVYSRCKIYKHIAGWEIHREKCVKNIENATT
jgi:hypothetical protein